jgi:hypothetical protein
MATPAKAGVPAAEEAQNEPVDEDEDETESDSDAERPDRGNFDDLFEHRKYINDYLRAKEDDPNDIRHWVPFSSMEWDEDMTRGQVRTLALKRHESMAAAVDKCPRFAPLEGVLLVDNAGVFSGGRGVVPRTLVRARPVAFTPTSPQTPRSPYSGANRSARHTGIKADCSSRRFPPYTKARSATSWRPRAP